MRLPNGCRCPIMDDRENTMLGIRDGFAASIDDFEAAVRREKVFRIILTRGDLEGLSALTSPDCHSTAQQIFFVLQKVLEDYDFPYGIGGVLSSGNNHEFCVGIRPRERRRKGGGRGT